MMRMNGVGTSLGRIVGSLCFCAALIFWWQYRGSTVQSEVLESAEVDELRTLGFAEDDEAIELLNASSACATSTDYGTLTHLYRDMLASYLRDLREIRKLGVSEATALHRFVQKRATVLKERLAVLERSQDLTSVQKMQAIRGMVKEHRALIAQCKKDLRACNAQGPNQDARRVAMLKGHIRDGIRVIAQLSRAER